MTPNFYSFNTTSHTPESFPSHFFFFSFLSNPPGSFREKAYCWGPRESRLAANSEKKGIKLSGRVVKWSEIGCIFWCEIGTSISIQFKWKSPLDYLIPFRNGGLEKESSPWTRKTCCTYGNSQTTVSSYQEFLKLQQMLIYLPVVIQCSINFREYSHGVVCIVMTLRSLYLRACWQASCDGRGHGAQAVGYDSWQWTS